MKLTMLLRLASLKSYAPSDAAINLLNLRVSAALPSFCASCNWDCSASRLYSNLSND